MDRARLNALGAFFALVAAIRGLRIARRQTTWEDVQHLNRAQRSNALLALAAALCALLAILVGLPALL